MAGVSRVAAGLDAWQTYSPPSSLVTLSSIRDPAWGGGLDTRPSDQKGRHKKEGGGGRGDGGIGDGENRRWEARVEERWAE